MVKRIIGKNKLLTSILLLAFLLRIVGLYPNFAQHPNEPGVIEPATKILKNILLNHNPDPNVEPHPFKYASAIFYMHTIIRSVVLTAGYVIHQNTGYTFSLISAQFGNPTFKEFLTTIGPLAMSDILLWFHRLPSVFFGTATALLVYKTALLFFRNRQIALLSALALAIIPHHVRDSHYATVDVMQAFFFVLAFALSVKAYKETNIKNCSLAGFAVGFSTSLKYFPLSLLPLILLYLLARKRMKLSYIIATILTMVFGYWLGMPYIFPHFQEIINWYKQGVAFYAPNQTETYQSFAQRLLPPYLHGYHLKFFLESGVGPILTSMGVVGIFYGLKKWRLATVTLLIIPIVNILFISLYLEAIYDTLIIPTLPFFAVFIGLGSTLLISFLSKLLTNRNLGTAVILFFAFTPPFINSAQASLSCTKAITESEAHNWIAENIPEGTKLAFQPNMRLPSKNFKFIRSEPKENFFLSEVQNQGAEYIALHSGYTDRYRQWLDDNILLSDYVKNNETTHLALQEFEKNAKLLKSFVRPEGCVNSRIYIYKLPLDIPPDKTLLATFKFESQNLLSLWKIGQEGVPSGVTLEIAREEDESIARYSYNAGELLSKINNFKGIKLGLPPAFYGTPLRSPFVEVLARKKYTASLDAKREGSLASQFPDGFLRLDFYADKNKEPILTRLSTRISPKSNKWEKLRATAYAPDNARFATISFQTSVTTEPSNYLLSEAQLLSDQAEFYPYTP